MSGDHNMNQRPQKQTSGNFWEWLPKAYRDGDIGDEPKFTKYNMETAFLAGGAIQQPVGVECDCPYLNIHDAVVQDHDKAISLLKQCLDEMQYAGWNKPNADQQGRWNAFSAVLNYLHPPVKGERQ